LSEVWSEGYSTDVDYLYEYYPETSPVFQRYCLLLRGMACGDTGEGTAHCELGFGQGISVNINAASNPGQYVATDFNPAHAATARDMAIHAGSDARLYDDSFEQFLARDDLPEFDSISLHGVWSWVSSGNRRIITKLAARHLKPGGIFYISYNSFPGWAASQPLRKLFVLHDRYAAASTALPKRIDAALKFSGALLDARPLFANATVGLDGRLKELTRQNRDYLAHEYMNRDWHCTYFTDVADELAEAKLEFVTTAEPLDVLDTINLTTEGIAFLAGIEHPIMREQIRDYFVNRWFRKDLYLRGARRLAPAEQHERTLAMRIVLQRPVAAIPMKVTRAQGDSPLQEAIFRPLLDELAARNYAPKSFGDLIGALPGLPLSHLVTASALLVGAGHAAPCQDEAAVQQVRKTCDALNLHLLERARTRDDINYLASPVTGSGVAVGRFQQLFLLAQRRGCDQPAEWAQFTWQLLVGQGQSVLKEGKCLQTAEENLRELTAQACSFAEERLPILRALGIV
jgi:SAM-dependent methyltransferase